MNASKLFDLSGQVALVTGGGRGIGRAIAEALAAHGARVAVCGRNLGTLEDAVRTIHKAGGQALAIPMNVGDDAEVELARDRLLSECGALDILVNNAGIDPHYASLEKTTPEIWNEIIAVNLTGVFRCCRILGASMIPRNRGSIINISSIAGHVGLKRQTPYCASKGGLEQFTKALAADWAEFGIRVNAIAYGYIETDLTAEVIAHPHIGPRLLSRIPMGRFGKTPEVVGAAVFLASNAASYVTGHSLAVDGGWTAT